MSNKQDAIYPHLNYTDVRSLVHCNILNMTLLIQITLEKEYYKGQETLYTPKDKIRGRSYWICFLLQLDLIKKRRAADE